MSTQTDNGRAFEWAVAESFQGMKNFTIVQNKYSRLAHAAFTVNSHENQNSFLASAKVAVQHIIKKENSFFQKTTNGQIIFNPDVSGAKGDVRDLILKNQSDSLGISCKNNHEAMKHSRLSGILDFVKEWGINPEGCSDRYWEEINPIFEKLYRLKEREIKWRELENKIEEFYLPILSAWQNEIELQNRQYPQTAQRIVKYLVGNFDFYKIIRKGENFIELQAWNFNNSLQVPLTNYPDRIIEIAAKKNSNTTKEITFDGGYQIKFRIHSATTDVEPSLKFDVTAIGVPATLYRQTLEVTI